VFVLRQNIELILHLTEISKRAVGGVKHVLSMLTGGHKERFKRMGHHS
jgi:hypothetical protein